MAEPATDAAMRIYPAETGRPLPPRDVGALGGFWWGELWVLNPGVDSGAGRRVQFVCDRQTFRVGFWLDAADLRRTNRSATLLVARPTIPPAPDERTPGVRIPAGSALVREYDAGHETARATYDDEHLIRADGYVATRDLDVVHGWDVATPESVELDGVLTGEAVTLRDAPRGEPLARLSLRGPLAVRQIERRGDAVLVRYKSGEATVVGWVDSAHFARRTPWTELRRPKGGGGGTERTGEHRIELEVGTLLVDEESGHVLGVVTRTGTFSCVGPCTASAPRIMLSCGYELRLLALRPGAQDGSGECSREPSRPAAATSGRPE